MLGAKYGFAQFMDCAAQTMDPYFVGAIAHTYTCTCMSQFFIFIYIYILFYLLFLFLLLSVNMHGLQKSS